jgi:hypothetical protein
MICHIAMFACSLCFVLMVRANVVWHLQVALGSGYFLSCEPTWANRDENSLMDRRDMSWSSMARNEVTIIK